MMQDRSGKNIFTWPAMKPVSRGALDVIYKSVFNYIQFVDLAWTFFLVRKSLISVAGN